MPSVLQLLNNSLLTTDEWFKTTNTTNTYKAYVKSATKWLREWANEGRYGEDGAGDPGADASPPQSGSSGSAQLRLIRLA